MKTLFSLAPLERFLLRNHSSDHPMIIRILMRFVGPVDRQKLSLAYGQALQRQPLLRSQLVQKNEKLYWQESETFQPLEWPEPLANDQQVALSELSQIDLTQSTGLRTRAYEHSDGVSFLIDVHHACSDGQGTRRFLEEWLEFYDALLLDEAPRLRAMDFSGIENRDHYPAAAEPIQGWESLRNFYVTVRGRTARLRAFPQASHANLNRSPAYLREFTFDPEATTEIRQCLKQRQLTLNDVGLAASFLAFAEIFQGRLGWQYITVANPVDLRRPSHLKMPGFNRFGLAFLRRQQSAWKSRQKFIDGIRSEMKYIKERQAAAEFVRGWAAIEQNPRIISFVERFRLFQPSLQFTCLGDVTRAVKGCFVQSDGEIEHGGLTLQRIAGFAPPAVGVPLSFAACETNQCLSLTIWASREYFDEGLAEQAMQALVNQMKSIVFDD